MKTSALLALLTVCAPFVAHAQNGVTSNSLPMAPKSAATSDAFVWRFMPPVGSRWTMRSFVRTTSTSQISMMQDNKPTTALLTGYSYTNKFTADYDVLSRDALGATTIRLTLREATQVATSIFQGKTTQLHAPRPTNPRTLDGATLTMKQAPDGKIWNVVGMRAFVRRVLEADSALDAKGINKRVDTFPEASVQDIIRSLSVRTGSLPLSPIRVGESWNTIEELPVQSLIPASSEVRGTRLLKALDTNLAVVVDDAHLDKGSLRQKLTPTNSVIDPNSLVVSIYGTSRVQRSSGLPLETNFTQNIKGNYFNQVADDTHGSPLDTTTVTRVVLEPRS